MAKKKNKRARKQKVRKKKSYSPTQSSSRPSNTQLENKAPTKKRLTIRERLYGNSAAGIFQLVSILPLFFGAWLAGGLVLAEVTVFAAITASVIAAQYTLLLKDRPDILFPKYFEMVSYVGQIFISGWVFMLTQSMSLAVMTGVSAVLVLISGKITPTGPYRVLALVLLLVIRMTLFGIMGVMSQLYSVMPTIVLQFGVLGFTPGLILGGALVAKYASVFEAAGWSRKREIDSKGASKETNEDDSQESESEEIRRTERPGLLSALYSLLMIVGPAIPISTAPLGLFPPTFLIVLLGFRNIPSRCEAFYHGTSEDLDIAISSANIAGGISFLLFVAGMTAQLL